jgi:ubiquinone/menaquinone biosynthesis C-methylase UbiE
MARSTETFQLSDAAAEAYESSFVPRLFARWAPHLIDAAGVLPGQAVLDVACGTGIVARQAADRMGERGSVVGVDLNAGMLAVAQRLRPDIEWRQGDAESLAFPANRFDVVLCQAALMFFPGPAQALREMARVVRPSGTVAVQVWASLDGQAGYGPFVAVAARHAGPEALRLLGAYWALGDPERLHGLFREAGLRVTSFRTHTEVARFASVDELVATEVEGTPLAERITPEVYGRILEDSRGALARFRSAGGELDMPLAGHLITARPA